MLEINFGKILEELREKKARRVLVQLPEGLKTRTGEIVSFLEKEFEVITIMDPCFGACDIKEDEAKRMGCDTILHFGHNEYYKTSFPTVYAPLEYGLEGLEIFLEKILVFFEKKNIKKIGLVTTIQYSQKTFFIKNFFEKKGLKILTKKGKRGVEGQVLGCDYSAVPNCENTLYFGDGLFHPLGIFYSSQKNVFVANPQTNSIRELGEEKKNFLKKRILLIEKAKECNSFGIIVSTKTGQNKISLARKLKKELEEKGKIVRIYAMDFISPEKLLGVKEEAFVNTACPRIGIDDYASYKKPVINAYEVKYLLGKSYDDYKMEE